MGTTTTSIFAPNFVKDLMPWLLQMFGEATAHAYKIIWDVGIHLLLQHLLLVAVLLLLILALSAVEAFLTRRWGWFASVLYNYLYFGTLFFIGLIWGPEAFANDYINLVCVFLYIACFSLVGVILTKSGLRRRF